MCGKWNLCLLSKDKEIKLKSINKSNIEKLRRWKNQHRDNFFYKKIITPKQQEKWFENYKQKRDDTVFMINYLNNEIGCIAFRIVDDHAEIYNVILGNKKFGKKGFMGKALKILCGFILDSLKRKIALKVLSDNAAKLWYENNGFQAIYQKDDFIFMELDVKNFKKLNYFLNHR